MGVTVMDYVLTDGKNSDFEALCVLLDASLEKLAGHIIDRTQYSPFNTLEKIRDVVLAYDGSLPVACAGFRHYEDGVAELKRVFVREEYRGRGISKAVLALLEKRAAEKGYTSLILETGAPLARSISLYKSLGYHLIDNYGPYQGMIHSVCMRKAL
jgi:GNAT superfamily N-acetyltransferase